LTVYKIHKPGQLSIQESDLPSLAPDEALVKVSHIGICGSDVQLFEGAYKGPFSYPIAFGHEWSGVVERTGNSVNIVRPGDPVTGDCSKFCGTCSYCRSDKNICEHIEKYGITIDGASADYIVRKEKYLYKAPAGIDLSILALSEPLAVSAHLIGKIARIAGSIAGKKVLVFGAGAIGLGAVLQLIHQYNCDRVDVFDIAGFRCKVAESLGARVLSSGALGKKKQASGYRALYDAEYDVIVESTGNAEIFSRCLDLVKPLGVVGSLGMIPEVTFQHKTIVVKALTIVGSIGGTGEFPQVIGFLNRNSELVRRLISHEYPIERTDQAFGMSRQTEQALKVLVKLG
jgi:threonine dehydrogenase-like Zn-dependent dehydrogenase